MTVSEPRRTDAYVTDLASKQRLLVVSSPYPPSMGGLERYVESSSRRLADLGWDVTVLAAESGGKVGPSIEGGLQVYRVPSAYPLGQRFPVPRVWGGSFRQFLSKLDSDPPTAVLLHSHLFPLSLLGGLMGKRWGCKVSMIGHGSNYVRPGGIISLMMPTYEHLMMWALRPLVSSYLGVSTSADNWWRNFGVVGSGIVHNGIDVASIPPRSSVFREKLGISKDDIVISYAARLVPQKGADAFAHMAMRLANGRPGAHFLIAGSGPLESEIRTLTRGVPNIVLLGALERSEVFSMLGSSDIFAYPSTYPEGLPTSLIEAGAMGTAIVSMDAGGVRDLIPSAEFGIVASSLEGFERELRNAIDEGLDPARAQRLRERIESDFDWHPLGQKLSMYLKGALPK